MNRHRFISVGPLLACFLLASVSCGGSSSAGQKIYFAAVGEMRSVHLDALQAYYKQRYDLTIEILPPSASSPWSWTSAGASSSRKS